MIVAAVAGVLLSLAGCATAAVIAWVAPDATGTSGILRLVWALGVTGIVVAVMFAALAAYALARYRQRR